MIIEKIKRELEISPSLYAIPFKGAKCYPLAGGFVKIKKGIAAMSVKKGKTILKDWQEKLGISSEDIPTILALVDEVREPRIFRHRLETSKNPYHFLHQAWSKETGKEFSLPSSFDEFSPPDDILGMVKYAFQWFDLAFQEYTELQKKYDVERKKQLAAEKRYVKKNRSLMKISYYDYGADSGGDFDVYQSSPFGDEAIGIITLSEAASIAMASSWDDGAFGVINPPTELLVVDIFYSGDYTVTFRTSGKVEIENR